MSLRFGQRHFVAQVGQPGGDLWEGDDEQNGGEQGDPVGHAAAEDLPFFKSGSSVTAALTVKTNIPKGGVSKPVSMARMPMMAKAIGSKPSAMAIGANTGTVSKMMEIESISAPSRNHTKIISAKMA